VIRSPHRSAYRMISGRLEEERGGDRQAEGLGGLQVDDEVKLIGRSTGRSPGLAPFKSGHIIGHAPPGLGDARPIAHEPPHPHKLTL